MRLLRDRVLVSPDDMDVVSSSGLYLGKKKHGDGVVVGVGSGFKGYDMVLSVGDRVRYKLGVGVPVELEGKDYLILHESYEIELKY